MKLSKGKFQTILILAIVLAAYLLLAFVIPFTKTAVFWLALVFTLAAFGLQLYVLKLSFEKGLDARSKFYGFPIARVASVYLIIQIVLSFLFMALAAFCPAWIAAVVFVLLLAAAAVGVVAADAMRDEVERQDRQLKTDVAAMRALQSRAAALTSRCEDAALKADAQKLSDAFRYSDPVTNAATKDIEHELSAFYDCAHGAGLAVVMPAWMEYVCGHDVMRFARFAVNVFGCEMDFAHPERTAQAGIRRLRDFFRTLGMPATLEEVGGRAEDIPAMVAHRCEKPNGFPFGGFVKIQEADMEAILRRCAN